MTLLGRIAAAASGRSNQAMAVRRKQQDALNAKAAAATQAVKAADKALEAAKEEQKIADDELMRAKAAARVKTGNAVELQARAQRLIDATRRAQAAGEAIDPAAKAAVDAGRKADSADAQAATGVPGSPISAGLKEGLVGAGQAAWREVSQFVKGGFDAVFNSFAKYLSPLQILYASLNTRNSGQEAASKGFQVLAGTIGGIFMPAFVLLGATLMTIASQLEGPVLEGMESLGAELPKLVASIADAIRDVKQYAESIGKNSGDVNRGRDAIAGSWSAKLAGIGEGLGVLPEGTTKAAKADWDQSRKNYERGVGTPGLGLSGPGGAVAPNGAAPATAPNVGGMIRSAMNGEFVGPPSPEQSTQREMVANMRLLTQSLIRSAGPGATSTSIGSVGREAQMAGLNGDPIEQKMFLVQQQQLKKLDEIVSGLERGESRQR